MYVQGQTTIKIDLCSNSTERQKPKFREERVIRRDTKDSPHAFKENN